MRRSLLSCNRMVKKSASARNRYCVHLVCLVEQERLDEGTNQTNRINQSRSFRLSHAPQ